MTRPYLITCLLLSLGTAAAVGATPSGSEMPAKAQALFEQRRALESRSHQGRIRILQTAETCIQAAENFRDYRSCEREEDAARDALRETLQPAAEQLRQEAHAFKQQR